MKIKIPRMKRDPSLKLNGNMLVNFFRTLFFVTGIVRVHKHNLVDWVIVLHAAYKGDLGLSIDLNHLPSNSVITNISGPIIITGVLYNQVYFVH
jgi:hypothetical protein